MKRAKILFAILGTLIISAGANKIVNNSLISSPRVVQAQHVKGDLGKFTVPKKMRGNWYGKYFDIGGVKSKTIDKLKITKHKIGGTVLHKQVPNYNGTRIPKKARNWARAYYPGKFKKDHGIKYVSMYPWVSPALSGTNLGLYRYKGHQVLIQRTTSSFRITNVYWKTKALAQKFGGHKPKELKRFGQF